MSRPVPFAMAFAAVVGSTSVRAAAAQDAEDKALPATGESAPLSASQAKKQAKTERLAKRYDGPVGGYARLFFTAASGFGFRFNNPYRLESQLGEDAASVSITQPFVDFGLSIVSGPPNGFQHGGALHVGSTVMGVTQPYLTPSYVLAYRASLPVLLYARLATPILLAPDVNVGGEVAASASYFFTSGIGVTSEIVFDLFYGAATLEQQYSPIPVLSMQLGFIADYEFLP